MHDAAAPLPLRELAARGAVDDVIVAVPDLVGRLQGSRVAVDHFLESVLRDGFAACTYLLASDVDMQVPDGAAFSPWDSGFGDLVLRPDLATLRRLPWERATALVIADATWPDGTPVDLAPRQILRHQLDRLAVRGLHAFAATELEYRVFLEPYRQVHELAYQGLTPATRFNVDYSLVGLGVLDRLGADLRSTMADLGVPFETARGECAPGQYEITFRYGPALATCDAHALYKTAAKAVATRHGVSLTFMAKYDDAEGSSGHVHFSLRDADDRPVFADPDGDGAGMSELMARFVAGQLACLPDFALLFAPTVNAYKRLRPGSFAPTSVAWGWDNRTCPIRVVGRGASLRFEHRVPGADANPYLAVAGLIAAGLHGLDNDLELPAPAAGNAFTQPNPCLPRTLEEALARWTNSPLAANAFGADVVRHIAAAARAEVDSFAASITDWERRRGFERG